MANSKPGGRIVTNDGTRGSQIPTQKSPPPMPPVKIPPKAKK